jgi:hypothetical protein
MVYDYGFNCVIIFVWQGSTRCIFHCCRSEGKRSYLHLGTDCFVPFNVAIMFPPQSPHNNVMSQMMLRIIQSGLFRKLKRDMEWDLRRSASGKLLAVSASIKWTLAVCIYDISNPLNRSEWYLPCKRLYFLFVTYLTILSETQAI